MLCQVTRPDSVVMEVEVDTKANGEDCLNKVWIVDTNLIPHFQVVNTLFIHTFV